MKKFNKNLRTRLMIIFILGVLIPVILMGIFYKRRVTTMLKTNAELMTSQTLEETKSKVVEYLRNLSQPLDMVGNDPILKTVTEKNGTEEHEQAIQDVKEAMDVILDVMDGCINVYYATEDEQIIITTNNQDGSEYELTYMPQGAKHKSWYTDAIGREKIEGIKALYQEPLEDDVTGKNVISLTQEVVFDGVVYGVIGLDIEFDTFEDYIRQLQLLTTGYVMLANSEGKLVIGNDRSNITTENRTEEEDGTFSEEEVIDPTVWNEIDKDGQEMSQYQRDKKEQYTMVVSEPITGWSLLGVISEDELEDNLTSLDMTFYLASLCGIFIALAFSGYITHIIISEVNSIQAGINGVANGDLTTEIEIKRQDQIGLVQERFNQMVQEVALLVQGVSDKTADIVVAGEEITHLADNTTSLTSEVADTISQVASGASEQANNTQEATLKAEELSGIIADSVQIIETIGKMTKSTNELSREGVEAVNTLITKASRSKENSLLSKSVFDEMVDSIENIDYISNAIADITSQTNLLSLNASIEAARAGEAGKGFAVVADEIRQLAEQSRKSTDEIKEIVGQIADKSRVAGDKLTESNRMLDEQNEAISLTKELFFKITTSIESLSDEIGKMLTATESMTVKKEDVVGNIQEIAAISEEYAASVEQVTTSTGQVMDTMHNVTEHAMQLNSIADELKEALSKFKI